MPQGGVSGQIVAGGGAAQIGNGQQQARQVAILGCAPSGAVNTIYQPGNQPAATTLLGAGPLLDEAALLLAVPGAPPPLVVPVAQSSAGAVSAAVTAASTNQGSGAFTLTTGPHLPIKAKVTTAGALATMAVRFSLDGGTTYGAPITSAAGWASTGVQVPGTYAFLTFGAATYVLNSTITIGVDGVVSSWAGGGAGTVALLSASPIDTYEVLITATKGGGTGTAAINVSLDNGFSSAGIYPVPSGGVVAVQDGHGGYTGLVLTASGTFTANDTYTALAVPPAPSSSAITAAITAMIASPDRPPVCAIHVQALPTTAANAVALASALDTALATAFAAGLDWQGFVECPSSVSGDIVMPSTVPIVDTDDTDAVIRTARIGTTANRVALQATTGGIVSPVTSIRVRRPFGWALMQRYVGTDPRQSLGRVADGPLNFRAGRDEKLASTQLGDVQINVPTSYDGKTGWFENITSGGFATKNLNTSALYQDAEQMRALNVVAAAARVVLMNTLGDRPPVNPDNTIAEPAARDYDSLLDGAVKRSVGVKIGGAFGTTPQVSSVSATILRSSVLGAAPRRLDASIPFKGLGMVSAATFTISVLGA